MAQHNLSGHTLGQYELHELLGVGGMGTVYRGYQVALKREVAVKVMTPQIDEQPNYIKRFNREAETSARLEHRHIVPIYDYGTQQGITYVVMRLLTGGTLSDRLRAHAGDDQPLPSLSETAEVLGQLASGLDYAHTHDVIHRDIKPSNVMFDNQGSAYLVDFGIAKLLTASTSLTETGNAIGTFAYMAPEQWRAADLTSATDQYALGVLVYKLVTGQLPFDAPNAPGLLHQHLHELPIPPHTFCPDVPPDVSGVLDRALEKRPAARFPTCTALAEAFYNAIRGDTRPRTDFFIVPVSSTPFNMPDLPISDGNGPIGAQQSRALYRRPSVWLTGLAMLAALVIIVVLGLLSGGNSDDSESTTLRQTVDALEAAQAVFAATQTALVAPDTPQDQSAITLWTVTPTHTPDHTTPASPLPLTPTDLAPTATLVVTDPPPPTYTPAPTVITPLSTATSIPTWTSLPTTTLTLSPTPVVQSTATATQSPSLAGTAQPTITPNALVTTTPGLEPCYISTTRDTTMIRVGPGFHRGVFDYMPLYESFLVIGQSGNDLDSEWWQIVYGDRELWVLKDNVEETGGCDVVVEADPPDMVAPAQPGDGGAAPSGGVVLVAFDGQLRLADDFKYDTFFSLDAPRTVTVSVMSSRDVTGCPRIWWQIVPHITRLGIHGYHEVGTSTTVSYAFAADTFTLQVRGFTGTYYSADCMYSFSFVLR